MMVEHAIPQSAVLELTKRCNLRCCHCYVAGDRAELPTGRWLRVVDELEAEGCLRVTLTGGEVALRRDWLTIAERVKRRRMVLTVLTNGTLLSTQEIDRLARARPFRVAVSIYGGDEASHERVTGVAGSFSRSVATVRSLRSRGVRCRISCTLMPQTLPEVEKIVALAEALGCEYMFDPNVIAKSDGDDSVLVHRLSATHLREYFDNEVITARSASREHRERGRRQRVTGNCSAGFAAVTIEAAGDVLPCVGLRPSFGSVVTTPFGDVWRGREAEEHRLRMRAPLVECLSCDLRSQCTTRCPRRASTEGGGLSAADPRACQVTGIVAGLRAERRLAAPEGQW